MSQHSSECKTFLSKSSHSRVIHYSITNHFIDVHEADHSSLKFMLSDQHYSELLKSENFWIGMLLTNRKGLNGSHDFAQQ